MDIHQIDNSPVPIRLFKSDFMEFFTHIHPAVIVIIWLPVAIFAFVSSVVKEGFTLAAPLGLLMGLLIWTLAEYTLHRFVFHYPPRTPAMERITFLFHGIHHKQPHIKTRLVMPPVVTLPLAVIFYGLFYAIFHLLLKADAWMYPAFSGLIIGYLVYDLTHYATHHFPMRSGYLKFLKRYHMQHHYKTPNRRFGVSSPLWDWVFKTYPGQESLAKK